MQPTTREILEKEFAEHGIIPEKEDIPLQKADEEFAEAPAAYVGEIRELFTTLPLAVRRYLYAREEEVEHSISELKKAYRYIDEAFGDKGVKRGFNNAQDWIEHLIMAEDLIEQNPAVMLPFLARIYGIGANFQSPENVGLLKACADSAEKINLLSQQINALLNEVNMLRVGFELKAQNDAKLLAKAEEAKAAKDAAFTVSGHRAGDNDEFRGLTTRQILERQFAALDD